MPVAKILLILAEEYFNFPVLKVWKVKFSSLKASFENFYRALNGIVVIEIILILSL